MTNDEDLVRDRLKQVAPTFAPIDGAAIRANATAPATDGPRWYRSRGVAALAGGVTVAALAVVLTLLATHRATSAPPATGDGSFTLSLNLGHSVAPANGKPIHGWIVADNQTGQPITIHGPCDGWVQAGLVGPGVSFGAIWPQVGCADGQLPTGVSRKRITILTSYDTCSEQLHPPAGIRACIRTPTMHAPPLPPGTYTVKIVTRGLSPHPQPPPQVTIALT